jgi:tRNA nucleotidyltransferase (CCA-adding enzyme)
VGGFVRDAMLGKHPKDADMEVYGISPERLEELLQQLFEGRVNAVGRAFGVYKVALGEGLDFDISIPRRESKTGEGHKGFAISGDPSMPIEEAARRRDFTFNALAGDPLTGEIIDPFGGLDDLRNGILKVTDETRFQDDPLRVYRALQFAARMDLTTDPRTFELLREMVARGDLDELPRERVTEEIKKLVLKSKKPSVGLELAKDLGIIEREYPELHALINTEQEPEWHPEGNVWIHTMMVLDAAANIIREKDRSFDETEQLQVMLGALSHDLGKPATTKLEDGRLRSLGHEEAGEEPTKQLFARWTFASDVEQAAIAVAKEHLKPSAHALELEKGRINEDQYANAVRRLLRRIHPVSWRVLIAASEADSRGRGTPEAQTKPYEIGRIFRETIEARHLDEEPTKTLIQGRDLLALGMKPGTRMGEIIRAIEEARDRGEVTTREEALEMAEKVRNGHSS